MKQLQELCESTNTKCLVVGLFPTFNILSSQNVIEFCLVDMDRQADFLNPSMIKHASLKYRHIWSHSLNFYIQIKPFFVPLHIAIYNCLILHVYQLGWVA